jgi:DNA adenine methylase
MSRFYSPLRYPGGKSCIFPFVSKLFYENDLIGTEYAEPYAGGAGLALKLLFESYVSSIHINDLDRSIYTLWRTILDEPERFCRWLSAVEISVSNWNKFKVIQNASATAYPFELAQSTLFLNRTNVSGVIHSGGIIGGRGQSGTYKIDARFNRSDLVKRIEKIASFSDRIHLSNLDGLEFLRRMDRRKKEVFVYLDPPYYAKGSDLYMNYYRERDHLRLAKYVSRLRNRWMISYDKQDFILNLYASTQKIQYKLSQGTSNRVGDEVLMFSNRVDFASSVSTLSGACVI